MKTFLIRKVYNQKRNQEYWFMRPSRVVGNAFMAALLASSLAAPASANVTKRQVAEGAFKEATSICTGPLNPRYPRLCEIYFFILDKIAGR